jgi:hypothetical protein
MERWGTAQPEGRGEDPGSRRERLDGRISQVGYHGPRRIRLVAYGARLERGLG